MTEDLPGSPVFPGELLKALEADTGAPAFEHGGRTVARGELLDRIGRFTAGLRAAGVGPGKGLALATAVTPEAFAVQIAGYVLGARVVGVPPGLPSAQVIQLVADADALVVDDSTATPELLASTSRVLRAGPELLVDGETPVPSGNPQDIATITYTSGSTGGPKGTEFSYAAMTSAWAWQRTAWTADVIRLSRRYERFLLFGTLASGVMQRHLGLCLLSGGTVVIPEAPPVFPDVLARLRISACLLTVPRLYHVLDELRERQVDLSSVRSVMVAGSPVAPHRLAQALDVFGDAMHNGYGQTEAGMLTLLTADDVRERPETLSSVGRPFGGMEVEIRNETGAAVPAGTTGAIWARTPAAFTAYRNDPHESAAVRRDGWVLTRDLGHFDEHGFLYLTGRSRDVIIVNAKVHYAGPIERALAGHPDVDQAYVVGAPDERTGEAAHAFVVAAGTGRPDPGDLRALVAEKLGEAAVPATITVVESVPIAPSGKPDKKALLASLRMPSQSR